MKVYDCDQLVNKNRPFFCRFLVDFWQIFGRIMAELWQNYGRIWQNYARIMAELIHRSHVIVITNPGCTIIGWRESWIMDFSSLIDPAM